MEKIIVSVIIPTYNEEKHLESCLQSIYRQKFSRKCIEIIVVDDGSTDATIKIAKRFKARILHSGFHHIERSKSIGIGAAKGKYLFFIDADIRLVEANIVSTAVNILENNDDITGVQCIYWKYDKRHTLLNRYCELFGINDPFPFYLGKRSIVTVLDHGWVGKGTLINETDDYYKVSFTEKSLTTLGSQAYMGRREQIKKYVTWQPYFFHMDSVMDLVTRGFNTFAMAKLTVEHDYVDSLSQFYEKLFRNIILFHKYRKYRSYDYDIYSFNFIFALLSMLTIVRPLYDSLRGYSRKPDLAWFLHPIICFTVPLLYTYWMIYRLFFMKKYE